MLQRNFFIEITLRHGCSQVNLRHIFRTHFSKNTSESAAASECSRHTPLITLPVTGLYWIFLEKVMGFRQKSVCKVGL